MLVNDPTMIRLAVTKEPVNCGVFQTGDSGASNNFPSLLLLLSSNCDFYLSCPNIFGIRVVLEMIKKDRSHVVVLF